MISTGSSFRWTIAGRDQHLWIVLSAIDPEQVVVANITTLRGRFVDRSCILDVGDHPFIQHESYVLYREAYMLRMKNLEDHHGHGQIELFEKLEASVMERILDGAKGTPHLQIRIKELLREQQLIF